MRNIVTTLTLAATALVAVACATTLERGAHPPDEQVALRLQGGADSQEQLVDWWLEALARNDEQRLHSLRVSREEYLAILVPWTVKPGEPPRQVSEQPREFFWSVLDTKSRDLGRVMLKEHGGRTYRRQGVSFSEPPRAYAGYRAYGLVKVDVLTEAGSPLTVEGPWIAEVGGRYKFIGLDWTD